jgi:hypothetical protein
MDECVLVREREITNWAKEGPGALLCRRLDVLLKEAFEIERWNDCQTEADMQAAVPGEAASST